MIHHHLGDGLLPGLHCVPFPRFPTTAKTADLRHRGRIAWQGSSAGCSSLSSMRGFLSHFKLACLLQTILLMPNPGLSSSLQTRAGARNSPRPRLASHLAQCCDHMGIRDKVESLSLLHRKLQMHSSCCKRRFLLIGNNCVH